MDRTDDFMAMLTRLRSDVDELQRLSASRWGSKRGSWHNVGDVGEPAFQNSWVNRGGTTRPARFRLDGDVVRLEGAVSTGTNGTTIFTLPAGYRPTAEVVIPIRLNDGGVEFVAYLFVQSSGAVSPNAAGTSGGITAVDFFVTFTVT